ncbi:MAG: hypothetical protein IJ916_00235 [Paludibacteraceae bacterium]|nr:hypothetical protein [Paludibacteraceae bacterium]MEE3484143.1 hypothetical protein [Bacteroidales bacterium]
MKLTAPTNVIFIISLILGILGLLGRLAVIGGFVAANAFWFVFVGLILLALGCLLKGL